MKREDWDYITNKWGDPEEDTLNTIAKLKEEDEKATADLIAQLEQKDAKIRELEQANINMNRTNMDLVLRLTDPANPANHEEAEIEEDVADLNDLDAFVDEEGK